MSKYLTKEEKKIKLSDDKMSREVRRVGKCERCGFVEPYKLKGQAHPKNNRLEDSHIIPKRYMPTRWLRINHQCLCYMCHSVWWHKESNDLERIKWIEKSMGLEVYKNLWEEARKIIPRC